MSGQTPEYFQALFREHYPSVVRKIAALVADRAIAEDLAQEVFLKLYRSPPDDLNRVGAWLHRVLTHTAYDYLRRTLRAQKLERQERQELKSASALAPSNEQIVIDDWEKDVVRRVLKKLSERDREVLLLKQQGYSYREIAERLQIQPKLIGSILARAAERFKRNYMHEEASTYD